MREKDEHVRMPGIGKGIDGRATGISGGCARYCHAFTSLFQDSVHDPSEKLHGHVLERERWAMEELKNEFGGASLYQGTRGRMPKGAIGLLHDRLLRRIGDLLVDERAHQDKSSVRIGQTAQ